jgi:predicted O-methyltransferase YrrM
MHLVLVVVQPSVRVLQDPYRALRRAAARITALRAVYSKADAIVRYWPHVLARPAAAVQFVFADREFDNYTYDISNRAEMAAFVATTLQADWARVNAYVDELERDRDLRGELNRRLSRRSDRRRTALYGRRAGWYAVVRLLQPKVVVEVGVHDGLGSAVILRALQRNQEGGRLIGIDINPLAGWLVPPGLSAQYELLIEDSAAALPRLARTERIDLLIVDGDHRYAHELAEYAAVVPAIGPTSVLLSDTSRYSTALRDFAAQHGRAFAFWAEQPLHHFFAGEGIGLSYGPAASSR